ncbi:MAG: heavy metal translocating P-type ATPase [Planctomycetota bacterium]
MTATLPQPEHDLPRTVKGASCSCSHCGQPVPLGLIVAGQEQQFCCQGCASVYELIHSCGLDAYYRLREQSEAAAQAVPATDGDRLAVFDADKFHELYVRSREDGARLVDLMLEGVHCAACVWLIEKLPRVVPGVLEARLSLRQATVRITWDPANAKLSQIAKALSTLGYSPHPARGSRDTVQLAEQRTMLIRMGVAGALAGNTMLLAFALYTGLFSSMEQQFTQLFRWTSAVLGVIALAWPGRVFFQGAWAALRTRSPHLDVPIALALGVGGVVGLVNVILSRGEIYFDSLTVLVFLLLVGRFIQYRQQRRADESVGLLFSLTPTHCRRVVASEDGSIEQVPAEAVQVNDLLQVHAGELIPADGTVEEGNASVIASLLTGESAPVPIQPGDGVCAGSQLASSTIRLRVSAVGEATRVGRLMELVQRGVADKPQIVALTDRIAGWFVVTVSTIALGVFAAWSLFDLSAAVDHTVALLIIACPCALGLATPLTLAVMIGRSARNDILIKSGAVLDRLAKPGRILMDKTGTMTRGAMRVEQWVGDGSVRPLVVEAERHATHPIALAIVEQYEDEQTVAADDIHAIQVLPNGVKAQTSLGLLYIGSRACMEQSSCMVPGVFLEQADRWAEQACTTVFVSLGARVVAALAVGDAIRSDVRHSIAQLRDWGWQIEMLTGDEQAVAEQVAKAVGLERSALHAGVSPEQKLNAFKERSDGMPLVMVGDGVNDAAALAAADVGIAVSGGAEASMAAADVYLAKPGLTGLVELIARARSCRAVVKQNLALSLTYNAIAISLAAAGLVTPLVAAVLMPLSSATVLALAMKGRRLPTFQQRQYEGPQR